MVYAFILINLVFKHIILCSIWCQWIILFSLQVNYLLRGLFARACKSLGTTSESSDSIRDEVGQLRGLLAAKLAQINTNLEGKRCLVCWVGWDGVG